MLGRLRMSTTEALAAYIELSTAVFSEKKVWIMQDGLFKATKLETEIKKTISRYSELHDADSDLLDTRAKSCKTCGQSFIKFHSIYGPLLTHP